VLEIADGLERSRRHGSEHLSLINLPPLMQLTAGRPEVVVGLLDGPVTPHPDLTAENITHLAGAVDHLTNSIGPASGHGTFVAGVLSAKRASAAPAICPGCTLLVRPIFYDLTEPYEEQAGPRATPSQLADAIVQSIIGGAGVLSLSASIVGPVSPSDQSLERALDYAMRRGALIVAAAGNQGLVASTVITRHPWVIPVAGFRLNGRPLDMSNLAGSLGKRGVGGPGENVVSLAPGGGTVRWTGTSAATPFITGALALLRSQLPWVPAAMLRAAVNETAGRGRSVVPPLLDAWAMYRRFSK
jgi:subtilisin family serine protease